MVNEIEAGFTMAYVMNRMGDGTVGDDRATRCFEPFTRHPAMRESIYLRATADPMCSWDKILSGIHLALRFSSSL